MSSTGLLVVTNPSKLARILPIIQQHHVTKTLYVQFCPDRRQLLVPNHRRESECRPVSLQRSKHIIGLYAQANELCANLDVRILLHDLKYPHLLPMINTMRKIQVVIFDRCFDADDVANFSRNRLGNASERCRSVTLDEDAEAAGKGEDSSMLLEEDSSLRVYENVVLGGTFDRLHAGHKTMLSEAVLRCSSKLTVGVTDTPMLRSKMLWELIEPCADRIRSVREFLVDVDPNVDYDIVPIVDPFGPTKDDPTFQMIVVSAETLKGGKAVNELRERNGLSRLDVHVVELLTSSPGPRTLEENEEEKVSSSNQRLRLLGTRLKRPSPRPNLPDRPHIIGLTGGIASGKTHVGEYLASLGAGVIFCDTLGHELYRKDQPLYDLIVKEFGEEVVDTQGGEINRRALGSLVFKDSTRLDRLNQLVWPALLDRVRSEIRQLGQSGRSVVVIEAAVLIKAGWTEECHEIWACIVPPEEAVIRQMDRNSISRDEATRRVEAQPSNVEQVSAAHVVFCSLWSREYTERQVARAYATLCGELGLVQ